MGLIDLKTDLKSLKYGKDTLGGGYSGQPYIQTSIPDSTNSLGPREDFLLRGGTLGAAADAATDIRRLTKMFTDTKSPNGTLFVAKQQLLSRTAPRTQTSGILNEGNYTPLSTLAQAGVVAFGGHLNKQGNPFSETGAYANNENLYGVKVKPTQQPADNRLVQLVNLTSNGKNGIKKKGVTLNDGVNVMVYTGGPGSILGVGSTGIRYSPTSQTPLTLDPKYTLATSQAGNSIWVYSSKLVSTPYYSETTIVGPLLPGQERVQQTNSPNRQGSIASPKIQDFRKVLRNNLQGTAQKSAIDSGATPDAPSYNTKNIEQRVNLGDPGQRSFIDGKPKSYADYTKGLDYGNVVLTDIGSGIEQRFGLDKINSLPIYRSENVTQDPVVNDLVKFRIAVIDNNDPSFKTFMHFRAFLDSMSNSYNATWNGFQYLGRSEQFYTYGGFTRTISLGWTVAAQSKQELIPMYKKLNYLASSLTGDYSPNGYMRGVLCQLTVGGYLYEQPGFITALTYNVPTESPWEIAIGANDEAKPDNTVKELPHIIQVTGFSFTPIQRFLPKLQDLSFNDKTLTDKLDETDKGLAIKYGDERYISLAADSGSNYNN